jgi:hypothetical protein
MRNVPISPALFKCDSLRGRNPRARFALVFHGV